MSPAGSVVELLFASSGIERELVEAARTLEILDGLSVPVASIVHLIATKILARDDRTRPQDRVDLGALFAVADDATLNLTREALRLVTERGYARGRDLAADLDAALAELKYVGPQDRRVRWSGARAMLLMSCRTPPRSSRPTKTCSRRLSIWWRS